MKHSKLSALAVAVCLAASPAVVLAAQVTMTMDDLPFQPIDGLSHLGVTFGFTVGGTSNVDADYNSGGPGTTAHTDDPSVEGTAEGVVQVDFDVPTSLVRIGFAFDTEGNEADAVSVETFDADLASLGTVVVPSTGATLLDYPSAQFVSTNVCVKRAVISFGGTAFRFVMDNLTFHDVPCGCPAVPAVDCGTAAKSGLKINDGDDAAKNSLKLQYIKTADAITQADLGDPVAGGTAYSVCLYDSTAGTPSLVSEYFLPGGDDWKAIGTKGFKFKDKTAENGIQKVLLLGGAAGKGKLKVQGKGLGLALPGPFAGAEYFDMDPEVTVQLIETTDGNCWEAAFDASFTPRNSPGQYLGVKK